MENREAVEMKRAVEMIVNAPLPALSKADLILVYLGAKPAADITLFPWLALAKADFETLLSEELHLINFQLNREDGREKEGYFDFVVAKNLSDAEKLRDSRQNKDFQAYQAAKGYPASFVSAFKNRRLLLDNKGYPADFAQCPINFPLTQNDWQAQFELIKKWNGLIKEYAPKLFEELQNPSSQ